MPDYTKRKIVALPIASFSVLALIVPAIILLSRFFINLYHLNVSSFSIVSGFIGAIILLNLVSAIVTEAVNQPTNLRSMLITNNISTAVTCCLSSVLFVSLAIYLLLFNHNGHFDFANFYKDGWFKVWFHSAIVWAGALLLAIILSCVALPGFIRANLGGQSISSMVLFGVSGVFFAVFFVTLGVFSVATFGVIVTQLKVLFGHWLPSIMLGLCIPLVAGILIATAFTIVRLKVGPRFTTVREMVQACINPDGEYHLTRNNIESVDGRDMRPGVRGVTDIAAHHSLPTVNVGSENNPGVFLVPHDPFLGIGVESEAPQGSLPTATGVICKQKKGPEKNNQRIYAQRCKFTGSDNIYPVATAVEGEGGSNSDNTSFRKEEVCTEGFARVSGWGCDIT